MSDRVVLRKDILEAAGDTYDWRSYGNKVKDKAFHDALIHISRAMEEFSTEAFTPVILPGDHGLDTVIGKALLKHNTATIVLEDGKSFDEYIHRGLSVGLTIQPLEDSVDIIEGFEKIGNVSTRMSDPIFSDRDEPCEGENAVAELSKEDRQLMEQEKADKSDIVDLILSYRNPASEEEKMRQIRIVMRQ